MKVRIPTNLAGGILAILLAVVVWLLIPNEVPLVESLSGNRVTTRFVPFLATYVVAFCGLVLVVQSLIFKRENVAEYDLRLEGKGAIYLLILVAYVLVTRFLGFLIACMSLGIGTLLYMRIKQLRYYIITVGVFAVVYVVFRYVMDIPFPTLRGLWS